ncbi:MAG: tRNA (N6-isopentenyl adenosine(37)-C2)-methylthiotransferase MiaB [Deltaproteobacteria bacterium]|nr:tRNA (N6-isopentenyl adenosine(37)-C2)-methylthiotransferase MiaB [Deltaproteobacteria bacterium]
MKHKKVYINTIGCQMNVYDSGRMVKLLSPMNYVPVDSFYNADLIIVNTCTIREKAVQKAHSFIGRLSGLKKKRPGLIIAVAGCVAQQQGDLIMARFPYVDIVMGTRAVEHICAHIGALNADRSRKIVDIDLESIGFITGEAPEISGGISGVSRYVTIMRGCDNFCTYCVVPYVRGREESRTPEDIIKEITSYVKTGVCEVTLLGQNVNSYGKKEGLCSFPHLLERVAGISGLSRIRFVTSHPKDLSDDLINAFGRIDKLCNHIHLPVQSGSDRILSGMHRRYTRDDYMKKLDKLRNVRPDVAVTTDIIVGFPGETDDDFRQTLDLIDRAGFDTLFAFAYSDRPEAPASEYPEKVDDKTKSKRLGELFSCQKEITRKVYSRQTGKIFPVLVEGISKKEVHNLNNGKTVQITGRTPENRIVNFDVPGDSEHNVHNRHGGIPGDLVGKTLLVRITKACSNSLSGELLTGVSLGDGENEGEAHAA